MFPLATFVRPFLPYISLRLQSGFRSVKNDFRNRQFTPSSWNLILLIEHRKNNRFFNFERNKQYRYAIEFTGIFFLFISRIMDPPKIKRQKNSKNLFYIQFVCATYLINGLYCLLVFGRSVDYHYINKTGNSHGIDKHERDSHPENNLFLHIFVSSFASGEKKKQLQQQKTNFIENMNYMLQFHMKMTMGQNDNHQVVSCRSWTW